MPAYPLLAMGLVAVALVVRLVMDAITRRAGRPLPALPSVITGVVLVGLTLVFDNLMIAVGLYGYPPEHLSGLRVGLAPLEDLSYPIAAALALPAVWHAMGGDR